MLDVIMMALLVFGFLALMYRWRANRERSPLPVIGSGTLLAVFVLWWYLLGPLLSG